MAKVGQVPLVAERRVWDFRDRQLWSNDNRTAAVPLAYSGMDHMIEFVRGFVTCPYSDERADQIVTAVKPIQGLHAYRLNGPPYADNARPVVVEALEVSLDADGTIRSKDALRWFVQLSAQGAESSQVAETWWNTRVNILGSPHGSRSSLFFDVPPVSSSGLNESFPVM